MTESVFCFSADDLASEEWRQVPGFPDYDASSIGRVRSRKHGKVRLLKPTLFSCGYWYVSVCSAFVRKHKNVRIHRLVLEAFIGLRPDGMLARHFPDRDTSNNRLSNLSWSTPLRNARDKWVHGTARHGATHPNAKISDEQVQALLASPLNDTEVAKVFGISQVHASRIRRRESRVAPDVRAHSSAV